MSTRTILSPGDRAFDAIVHTTLIIVAVVGLYPFLHVLLVSITSPEVVGMSGTCLVWPRKITLEAYREVLSSEAIRRALFVSVTRTVVGTAVNLTLTTFTAFPLSRRALPGRSVFLTLIVFTLLFSGGIIPTYLLVARLRLIDTVWALILPTAINPYYVIIMKNYFEGLPDELYEAASVEGASELQILTRVILPLSMPILATLGLFYAVSHWNAFFNAIIFINDRSKYPLQVLLREIVVQGNVQDVMGDRLIFGQNMKMAVIAITTIPILVIYPLVQRHFAKGITLGAIKG
ncbi:MAG: carbohydrate ABC transporter permease [Clostridia bacterium]|nr:carbohydrate ABC transporter permease [Clostridia bacterium]